LRRDAALWCFAPPSDALRNLNIRGSRNQGCNRLFLQMKHRWQFHLARMHRLEEALVNVPCYPYDVFHLARMHRLEDTPSFCAFTQVRFHLARMHRLEDVLCSSPLSPHLFHLARMHRLEALYLDQFAKTY
jgi:hypothetical protein